MRLSVSPGTLASRLVTLVLVLTFLSILGQYLRVIHGWGTFYGLIPKFNVDYELNIPTWYAASALLLAGLILGAIAAVKAKVGDRYSRHWIALAVIFVLLSLDEAAAIHELAIGPVRRVLDTDGFLLSAWVIPGAVFVVLFALAYLRFLLHLPRRTAVLIALAGVIFAGGALGMEMVGAYIVDVHGGGWWYTMAMHLEEFMEKIGMVIFIYALLDYVRGEWGDIELRLGVRSAAAGAPDDAAAGEQTRGTVADPTPVA